MGEPCLIWGEWKVAAADGKPLPTDHDAFGRLRFKTVAGGVYKLSE